MKRFIVLILLGIIYLLPRVAHLDTIEFGYDQPKLASVVNNFIEKGNFLTSQRFVQQNSWGGYSWGAANIWFYTPFLLLSKHPAIVSILIYLVNFIATILVVCIGWRFFSHKAGIIAGLFLSLHPWWMIFSGLIYQPTPALIISVIIMLLFFETLRKNKNWTIAPLIIFSILLFETYHVTISFLIPTFVLLFIKIRSISLKFSFIGFLLSLLIFSPTILFFANNPEKLQNYFKNTNVGVHEKNIYERIIKVTSYNFKILSGGKFDWELGYGTDDFIRANSYYPWTESLFSVLMFLIVIYHIFAVYFNKKYKIYRLALILWSLSSMFFLIIIWAPGILPRYFLTALPATSLLIGLFFSEVFLDKKILMRLLGILACCVILFYFVFFMFRYNFFIRNYSYDQGFLSYNADPPYYFLDKIMGWISEDVYKNFYQNIVISNDPNNPYTWTNNDSTNYFVKYVYKFPQTLKEGAPSVYYLVVFNNQSVTMNVNPFVRFGPYTAYKITKPLE